MTSGPEPVGTVEVALAHAEKLLDSQPRLAAEQAREILGVVPRHPAATLLLAMALRRTSNAPDAVQILEPLVAAQPRWPAALLQLGLALGDAGRGDEAVATLRTALRLQPTLADAWRLRIALSGTIGGAPVMGKGKTPIPGAASFAPR